MKQEASSSSNSSSIDSRKRERDEEGDSEEADSRLEESTTSKRFCQQNCSVVDQDLCSILEEAEHSLEMNGAQQLDETQQGLVSDVMRSLEEELGVSSSCSDPAAATEDDSCQDSKPLDIGYLLEASDDELGISSAAADEIPQLALVEAEDLVRGESWNQDDWSDACADFSDEGGFMGEIGIGGQDQQEWLRRTLELFLENSDLVPPAVTTGVLGSGFEPTTPVLEAGLIL